ncbi:3-hydroxyacyl-CoA dehydrogenase NAD-binding domain-containing protein [Pseudaestuariivita atlantica]|uniref:3-hydroxyacyl-CoA dehydrogenase n=1 Tax=Pseudaestuariivita atlantica TaxID=1317121 RepID=A0A0L1JKP9_9RHOB|nr:3-hydroxyacyl-CoA dehydrogenase NAD-binding domain-containing protein [Pseudaestuariivita atlantica]KNG92330.1 3-hydroxyacyl-CoA dehydrogenase [Pseudaestuariivita atlantica]
MTVSVTRTGAIARVTIDNPPVNAASHAVRSGLMKAVADCEADAAVTAVILHCAGRTFVAGADIREFDAPPQEPHLPDVIAAIEGASKPWIAVLHGTVLGGGLELAMGCHARVAAPGTRLGLPEVNLGLIPGAGGTVRLPRLVPADVALTMIAGGKPVPADAALASGLIDAVAGGDLLDAATALAGDVTPEPTLDRAVRAPQDRDAFDRQAATLVAKARGQVSVAEAVRAVERALDLPAAEALAAERAAFLDLKGHPQARALRYIFFAERGTLSDPRCKGATRPVEQVAVVGGGTMGSGIAAACLFAGLTVHLMERDAPAASAGSMRVAQILDGAVTRGRMTQGARDSLQMRFSASAAPADLAQADLVIEAVFEDRDAKTEVFAMLDAQTRADAILATNTSYLDVTALARTVADPSRVIGLHFFAPAHIMKLLEIVVPDGVADDVVATAAALSKRLGKTAVLAGVCDGFIANRVLTAYRQEADALIEGGASPYEVDAAMRGFGMPMGVFEMQDLSGLDIGWAARKRRAAAGVPGYRPAPISDALCEAGWFGRKTGRGWYRYDEGAAAPCPDVAALLARHRPDRPIDADRIMARILGAMQREGAAILDEGIAARASDIDVAMVAGFGFPRWRGGPMFLSDTP